jgi:uncharacterized protein
LREFIGAAKRGDLATVERCVTKEPGFLYVRDKSKETLLMHASTSGNVELVRYVLDHGAAVDDVNEDGYTALGYAAGVNVTRAREGYNWHGARKSLARSGGPVVALLLERGADPATLGTDRTKQRTPLMAASEFGEIETVQHLLGHHRVSDFINLQDDEDQTALFKASDAGQTPVVAMLLERGADPMILATTDEYYDEHGRLTPLMAASASGNAETVRALLDHPRVDEYIDLRDLAGETALHKAAKAEKGSTATVKVLLERGADPWIKDENGDPAIDVSGPSSMNEECAKLLEVSCSLGPYLLP